jgi:hypothetical protein
MSDFRFEEYNSKKHKYEFGLISRTFIFLFVMFCSIVILLDFVNFDPSKVEFTKESSMTDEEMMIMFPQAFGVTTEE